MKSQFREIITDSLVSRRLRLEHLPTDRSGQVSAPVTRNQKGFQSAFFSTQIQGISVSIQDQLLELPPTFVSRILQDAPLKLSTEASKFEMTESKTSPLKTQPNRKGL